MEDLLTGESMLFTEPQNIAVFKSYHIFKFGNLVGFLIKKDDQFKFSDISSFSELLLHFESNFAEIWIRVFTYRGKKSEVFFFKYCQFL